MPVRRGLVNQPTASPDGRSVAWVELRADGPRVVTSSRAGGNHREIPLTLVPFFLAWDPTSRRIAYLGNAGSGVGLGVIDDAVIQPRDVPVGGGTPLYLAWSPDGKELLVHVGANGLGRTDLRAAAAADRRSAGNVSGTRLASRRSDDLRHAERSAQALEVVDDDLHLVLHGSEVARSSSRAPTGDASPTGSTRPMARRRACSSRISTAVRRCG